MSSLRYWLWLSRRAGPHTAQDLLRKFGTPEDIYYASAEDYYDTLLSRSAVERLKNKSMDNVDAIINRSTALGCRILTMSDSAYPERLRQIFDPPTVLYVRGNFFEVDDKPVITIVGTRKCTHYGLKTATRLGYEIGSAGGIIASGLAAGIDSAAAMGALDSGAHILGVLGCGVDVVYPKNNAELFKKVMENGSLISEYPPGSEPAAGHFPQRNRILSGLALGTVVVEAPRGSGALITAERALEQGRDVFAVPGNVDLEGCKGTNHLIGEGAFVATSGEDVVREYRHLFKDVLKECKQPNMVSNFIRPYYQPKPRPISVEHLERVVPDWPTPEEQPEKEKTACIRYEIPPKKKKSGKTVIKNPAECTDEEKLMNSLSKEEKLVVKAIGNGSMTSDEVSEAVGIPLDQVATLLTLLEMDGILTEESGNKYSVSRK